MDLRFRSATTLILGLLLVACSDRRPPGEAARGIGPLAERMLSDRAADWLTIDVPGVFIHVRQGSAAEADRRAIVESVSAVRHEVARSACRPSVKRRGSSGPPFLCELPR